MIDHSTLSVGSTGVRELAQIDTASIQTGLGRLTVSTDPALDFPALHLGVALEALGTGADRTVAGDDTLRSGGTGGGETGVLAGAVTANLLVATVGVQETARQTGAALAEMSLRTGNTAATLLPTPTFNTTLPALAVLVCPTFLDTDPGLAPVSSPALRAGGAGEGEGETLQAGVPGGRGWAGAESLVVGDLTLGTPPTGGGGAGVLALRVDAGLAGSTLRVRGAASNTEPLLAD